MTDPAMFPVASPRFGLPLLSVGQAQKEVFVNEAHCLTDALLHCSIEGTASDPPVTPVDGTAWRIGSSPTGEWIGHGGELACRQGGNWLFVVPLDGLRVLDRSTGQYLMFLTSWRSPLAPLEPVGGTVVDTQAREAIVELIALLRQAGILSAS